jgi:TolB-like protein
MPPRLVPASAGAPAKGLVVLPFGNLSPDPENEFFADGLTEEVIADLSGISALRVISRTSAMRFKGTDKDLRTIARELNVRYVLEGSVRRAGTSLRVTAQLIEADTDSHVWAEKYSGSVDDVFAIQEEISRKIVKALQVKLSDTESRKVAERPIDNPPPTTAISGHITRCFRFTPASLDRAQTLADAGLALIGENPLLLATRGLVSWYYLNFSIRPRNGTSTKRRPSRPEHSIRNPGPSSESTCVASLPQSAATLKGRFATSGTPARSNQVTQPPSS